MKMAGFFMGGGCGVTVMYVNLIRLIGLIKIIKY